MQKFRCCSRNLDQRVHIVIIFVGRIHLLLDVLPCIDCTAHLLVVCTGVIYIAHTAATPNGRIGNLRQYFLAWTAQQSSRKRNAVTHTDERRQPAAAYKTLITVTGNIEIGVAYTVYHQIIAVRHINGRRTNKIHYARDAV